MPEIRHRYVLVNTSLSCHHCGAVHPLLTSHCRPALMTRGLADILGTVMRLPWREAAPGEYEVGLEIVTPEYNWGDQVEDFNGKADIRREARAQAHQDRDAAAARGEAS